MDFMYSSFFNFQTNIENLNFFSQKLQKNVYFLNCSNFENGTKPLLY